MINYNLKYFNYFTEYFLKENNLIRHFSELLTIHN